jgi:uncharacterized LabA/DUF88 family protein
LLIAGDADYAPAIQAVQRVGVNVVLASVKSDSLSDDLRRAADRFVEIGPRTTGFPPLFAADGKTTWPVSRR